jgi:two-component system, chemotaxis family, chemotaxis protein CheY
MGRCAVPDPSTHPHPPQASPVVLVVDDDADIANLLEDLLTGEGYAVALLRDRRVESVQTTVERLRPDCVLLDGAIPGVFGESWADAAWMAAMPAPVPVIMFSADTQVTSEARSNESTRSRAAHFSSVLPKPFDLDELLSVVALAVSQSPFRAMPDGEQRAYAVISEGGPS